MTKPKKYPITRRGRPKHGAWGFLRTGVLFPGKEHIERFADSIICEYTADLGGADSLSAGQLILLREIKTLLIYKLLIDEHLAEKGIFTQKGELDSALGKYHLGASNAIQRACERLGLKRQSKELSLQDYLRQNYPEPDTPVKSATASQDDQGGAIVPEADQRDGQKASKEGDDYGE